MRVQLAGELDELVDERTLLPRVVLGWVLWRVRAGLPLVHFVPGGRVGVQTRLNHLAIGDPGVGFCPAQDWTIVRANCCNRECNRPPGGFWNPLAAAMSGYAAHEPQSLSRRHVFGESRWANLHSDQHRGRSCGNSNGR